MSKIGKFVKYGNYTLKVLRKTSTGNLVLGVEIGDFCKEVVIGAPESECALVSQ